MGKYDFSGWASKANLKCSDGLTILKDAFKHCDGQTVPLVWNHSHNDPTNVLGHALLENREQGLYAYCTFNDTEYGQQAKSLVKHGDIVALSIYANQLKKQGLNVEHGVVREVSLVLAGANPGAFIDSVISHADGQEEEAVIYTGEDIYIECEETIDEVTEDIEHVETVDESIEHTEPAEESIEHAEDSEPKEEPKDENDKNNKTVKEIFDSLNKEQKTVVYALIGEAVEQVKKEKEESNGGNKEMKHNVFENDTKNDNNVLSHSAQAEIIELAKKPSVGSLQEAVKQYVADQKLQHGFVDESGDEAIELLFPDYKNTKSGAPETITRDLNWVGVVMNKVSKSPISRIRTRQADATIAELRAQGYTKGSQKKVVGNIKLISRTTDPQTVYRKDKLERDDIIDITDFDVVQYQYGIMKDNLNEELATAFLIGDGREDGTEGKIEETHIRSIWHDNELYTIHAKVDIAGAKASLQGTNTSANFGENYIYAEAIIQSALYAREKYKGSGSLDFFCTPHLLNVMLLARDLNGRRIYDSKADLAAALNVNNIYTVEQFEGKQRTASGKTMNLLGIFVNLGDYQVGSTKGGEITRFEQFDIDFNQYKYLIETRLSGALVKVKSAIVLEEEVAASGSEDTNVTE